MNIKALIVACLILSSQAKSQITLDHTYSNVGGSKVINFSQNGRKIAITDIPAQQIKLYNTDYSLWKTINIPTVFPGYTFKGQYQYMSDNLFNTDNAVEFIAYFQLPTTGNPYYMTAILDENGNVVKNLDSAYITDVHVLDNSVFKLFAYRSGDPISGVGEWSIYNLPGELPCDICGGGLGVAKTTNAEQPYLSEPIPNPSSEQTTIKYVIPANQEGRIELYNIKGQLLQTHNVTNTNSLIIDNSALAPGIYYYTLRIPSVMPCTKTMTINK